MKIIKLLLLSTMLIVPSDASIVVRDIATDYKTQKRFLTSESAALSLLEGSDTKCLRNLRFYGDYGPKDDDIVKKFPLYKKLDSKKHKNDYPQDATSALLQWLFPSPDGQNFAVNNFQDERKNLDTWLTIEKRKISQIIDVLQKIKKLNQIEKNDETKKIDLMNEFIRLIMSDNKESDKKIESLKKQSALIKNQRKNISLWKIYQTRSTVDEVKFSYILLESILENTNVTRRYPSNIVEQVLLSYV